MRTGTMLYMVNRRVRAGTCTNSLPYEDTTGLSKGDKILLEVRRDQYSDHIMLDRDLLTT